MYARSVLIKNDVYRTCFNTLRSSARILMNLCTSSNREPWKIGLCGNSSHSVIPSTLSEWRRLNVFLRTYFRFQLLISEKVFFYAEDIFWYVVLENKPWRTRHILTYYVKVLFEISTGRTAVIAIIDGAKLYKH